MPMRYATDAHVYADLKVKADDTVTQGRISELENGLAAMFDQKVGHGFGVEPVPETRTVRGAGSDVLALGYPGVRSIESIAIGGHWDGVSWMDETYLSPFDGTFLVEAVREDVIAVRLVSGIWGGLIRITAVWADQPLATVPDDVREAMRRLTVKEYRCQTSSSTEQVGPDGFVTLTPSGWRDPMVKDVIAHHRVRRARVGV